ncbi:MAG: hypothetical protein KKH04_06215 [Proteobacteria bacterium]|nr:hypothetical protein [Pseudomonadota bacterium]
MDSLIHNRLNFDGFVKSPSAALRFTFVVAAYLVSTPHSSGFARLASGAFYFAIPILTFYETINFEFMESGILFEYTHIPFLFPLFFSSASLLS